MAWNVKTKCSKCETEQEFILECARDAISHQSIHWCKCGELVCNVSQVENIRKCRTCKGEGCEKCKGIGYVQPKSRPTTLAPDKGQAAGVKDNQAIAPCG